jgi:hypothetical protein
MYSGLKLLLLFAFLLTLDAAKARAGFRLRKLRHSRTKPPTEAAYRLAECRLRPFRTACAPSNWTASFSLACRDSEVCGRVPACRLFGPTFHNEPRARGIRSDRRAWRCPALKAATN